MTVAVCLECGELKHGAFNPCPACGYTPDDEESWTKHLLVTDHYHDRDTLEQIAAGVRAGTPPKFDRETLEAAWITREQMAEMDKEMALFAKGCTIVLVMGLIGAAVLAWVWNA